MNGEQQIHQKPDNITAQNSRIKVQQQQSVHRVEKMSQGPMMGGILAESSQQTTQKSSKVRGQSYNPMIYPQSAQTAKRSSTGIRTLSNKFGELTDGKTNTTFSPEQLHPRAVSSNAYKMQKKSQTITQKGNSSAGFQSKYLEQQQPKLKNKLQNLIGDLKQPTTVQHDDGFSYQQFEQW